MVPLFKRYPHPLCVLIGIGHRSFDKSTCQLLSFGKVHSEKGERGRIDKEMLTKRLSSDEVNHAVFYVCVPPAMVNAMKNILEEELKIVKERIKVEEFTGY
jgi:ferredoxin-NADP reductase